MVAENFWYLVTDPAHWGLELVTEVAFFVLEVAILDHLLHRHDKETDKVRRKRLH